MSKRKRGRAAKAQVADCVDRIARQREVITTRYEQGLPVDVAESMLRALEESLHAVEKHRQYVIERLKDSERPKDLTIPMGRNVMTANEMSPSTGGVAISGGGLVHWQHDADVHECSSDMLPLISLGTAGIDGGMDQNV
jgi:hypothetical protein